MNTHDIELPPLPYVAFCRVSDIDPHESHHRQLGVSADTRLYTEDQVRAAIEADSKTYNPIGEETIQQLHDVLLYLQNETMKLEAAYGSNFKKEATEKARAAAEKMKEAVYAIKKYQPPEQV